MPSADSVGQPSAKDKYNQQSLLFALVIALVYNSAKRPCIEQIGNISR